MTKLTIIKSVVFKKTIQTLYVMCVYVHVILLLLHSEHLNRNYLQLKKKVKK